LQQQPALPVKDQDMRDAMNQLRIAVALGAQCRANHLIIGVDNLKKLTHTRLLRQNTVP
jgi:hypothetical protein